MKRGMVVSISGSFLGLCLMVVACSDSIPNTPTPKPLPAPPAPTQPGVTVKSLAIVGSPLIEIQGKNPYQLKATGTYSDGSTKDVTASAIWKSLNTVVATVVIDKGLVNPAGYGVTDIAATFEGQSAIVSVRISLGPPTRVDFGGPNPRMLALGEKVQLELNATYGDGSKRDVPADEIVWVSSNTTAVSVSSVGLAIAKAVGTSTITITYQEKRAEMKITVAVPAPPPAPPPVPTPVPAPTPAPPTPPGIPGGPGTPSIEFTSVPPIGSFANLTGKVLHVNPADHRVEVYIKVGGWWTKPTFASPQTLIASDGTFVTDITTGGFDETATSIAAFLVTSSHVAPPASGQLTLPISVNHVDVLDVAIRDR